MNYIEEYQKNNKNNTIEVYQQSGLGREGEYSLFLGLDCLSKSKKKKFLSGLARVIQQQNDRRNLGRDGSVALDGNYSITKKELLDKNNVALFKNNLIK